MASQPSSIQRRRVGVAPASRASAARRLAGAGPLRVPVTPQYRRDLLLMYRSGVGVMPATAPGDLSQFERIVLVPANRPQLKQYPVTAWRSKKDASIIYVEEDVGAGPCWWQLTKAPSSHASF
jgi:hypothetical protein